MLVCRKCFCESVRLDSEFQAGTPARRCPTCNASNVKVLDTDKLCHLFEPLKQLYEVAQEGEHYAWDSEDGCPILDSECDDLLDLLQNDWQLFSDDIDYDEQRNLLGELWGGWDDTEQYSCLSLFESWADEIWSSISRIVMHKWRFFTANNDELSNDFSIERDLGHYIDDCKYLNHTADLIRARIGRHKDGEMSAPPPEKIKRGGRANPAGIAYLYLATDVETSVAEVRAEPGEDVTIAKFQLPSTCRIADLSLISRQIDPLGCDDLKYAINRQALLSKFAETMSRPIRSSDSELEYVPTQYISEFFRLKKFDGLCFKSSLCTGTNLVLFDPDIAIALPGVEHVTITEKQLKWK